jgi:type VI secretion system protein ImpA
MPLREDLLTPIAGDNPSGADLRYDNKLLLYDKIKEARRQDDDLNQGAWQHERKVGDYREVMRLTQEALATRTKDLQLAAWLTDALLRVEGFGGLQQGLTLCHGLLGAFWEGIYPPIEDGDLELRAGPLDWLGTTLELPLKLVPLVRDGYDFLKYKDSKLVGYEEQAQNDKDKKARAKKIAEGKLAPEAFDKSFADTPKAFYVQAEKNIDASLAALQQLDQLCEAKFGAMAPSFGKLKAALEEVRLIVHQLLQKKRESEPDPVVASPEPPTAPAEATQPQTVIGQGSEGSPIPAPVAVAMVNAEPVDRRDAVNNVARAAAFLRKQEPHSPAPYLMMRGLRWGELRAAAKLGDATLLEAPPTELRQQLKRLALTQKWTELLELGENSMALPCSRAWLDLQRLVVEALSGLGSEYSPIADAIRSELRVLLTDLPELLDASLLDDTAAANPETRAWLKQLAQGPAPDATAHESGENPGATNGQPAAASWPAKARDSYSAAQDALKAGEAERAFQIMRLEIAGQRSGRGRFQRTLQLVQLCVTAGKDTIAQPLLEDLMSSIESHKLDDWEEKELVAAALATVMTVSKKVQANAADRQKLFERICRLDPVRALGSSG